MKKHSKKPPKLKNLNNKKKNYKQKNYPQTKKEFYSCRLTYE